MCKKKTLDDLRTAKDVFTYAEQHGGCIEYGGRHAKVRGPGGGIVAVPCHPGDLKTGTLRSIIKMLVAVGLGIMILAIVL